MMDFSSFCPEFCVSSSNCWRRASPIAFYGSDIPGYVTDPTRREALREIERLVLGIKPRPKQEL
jgi:hypothetical protein